MSEKLEKNFKNSLQVVEVNEEQAIVKTIVKGIIEQIERMQNGEEINFEKLLVYSIQKNNLPKRETEEEIEEIISHTRQILENARQISFLKDGICIKDEEGIIATNETIIDSIKREMINRVQKMPDGEAINFEELMIEIIKNNGIKMKRSPLKEKRMVYQVRQMLRARQEVSCLKDGNYIKDKYGIIADQEAATIKREEAIQVGERIKKEIEAEGKKATKEEILDCLEENFKENQLYRTWITVLCSNGTLLEKEDENELDR